MRTSVLARWASAVLVVAIPVAAAATVADADPVASAPAPTRPLPLTARSASLVCPGPETLVVPDGASPVTPGGPVTLTAAVSSTAVVGQGEATAVEARVSALGADRGVNLSVPAGKVALAADTLEQAGAVALQARTPAGADAPLTSAVQTTLARRGDLRGLVARSCAPAATTTWLVGSSTVEGRRGRLLLANPTPAPATVDVRVLTPDGPADPPNGQGVIVPASSQVALLVDALVPAVPRVAVRVQARDGRIVATLHDSVVRGLIAGGADDVGGTSAPARQQVIPGLSVRASDVLDGSPQLPADPADPGAVAVRVAVPGGEDGIVHVRLLGSDGEVELPAGIVDVGAGSVADVAITGVPDGVYAALVEADVPIVAGAIVGRASEGSELAGTPDGVAADVPPAELAWSSATDALAPTVLAVPARAAASLSATASAAPATLTYALVSARGVVGDSKTVPIPAGTTVSLAVPSGSAALTLTPGGGPVHAALMLEASDGNGALISVVPVQVPPPSAQSRRPVVERPRLGLVDGGGDGE